MHDVAAVSGPANHVGEQQVVVDTERLVRLQSMRIRHR
jgi:hypothetical protein